MDKDSLIRAVQAGEIDPVQAVQRFESPSIRLGDISISDLKINVTPSGFPTLDDYYFLKQNRSELIILGARPSHGKSAFMCQIAASVAAHTGVMLFSLEMDKESIKARHLAALAGIPLDRIQAGKAEQAKLAEADRKMKMLNYYIDDRPRLNVTDIVDSARTTHRKTPLGLVIVDYLQLIQVKARNTRHEELGDVTGALKGLAKELGCPVLAASQLSRACEQRGKLPRHQGGGDYRPQLSDLRDSGNLEQDADMVLFLSREFVYNGTRMNEADIGVAKNKNGKTGWEVFRFYGSQTKFVDPQYAEGEHL